MDGGSNETKMKEEELLIDTQRCLPTEGLSYPQTIGSTHMQGDKGMALPPREVIAVFASHEA